MFDGISGKNVKISEGKLTLSLAEKSEKSSLLTLSMDADWTFKSKIEYTPKDDSYAGIISKQDNNNFVIAGLKLIDGKNSLFIGKYNL